MESKLIIPGQSQTLGPDMIPLGQDLVLVMHKDGPYELNIRTGERKKVLKIIEPKTTRDIQRL